MAAPQPAARPTPSMYALQQRATDAAERTAAALEKIALILDANQPTLADKWLR